MAASSVVWAGDLELKSENACFGGRLLRFVHQSKATKTPMTFTVFLPPRASSNTPVPVLYYLSGLTCTDENFIQKAGAQRVAALRGIALVAPDTSPRGAGIAGEDDGWDFGTGAGFYVDATEPKWKENYRMYEYVTRELPGIISTFPVDTSRSSLCGHSMGGHGALIVAFRNPDKYRSVSAFSAICHPVDCPWGKKAFSGYLGADEAAWRDYDATEIMHRNGPFPSLGKILMDQGSSDGFFTGGQLKPEALVKACEEKGQPIEMRMQVLAHPEECVSTGTNSRFPSCLPRVIQPPRNAIRNMPEKGSASLHFRFPVEEMKFVPERGWVISSPEA